MKKFKGKGQSRRLQIQHELSGGPTGIFGVAAREHDLSIREVMVMIAGGLATKFPDLDFRH